MSSANQEKLLPRPAWLTFACSGGAALSGWMFVHPADVLKVRSQLIGESGKAMSATGLAKDILRAEGVTGLYAGLSAAAVRQLTYSNLRLGLYQEFKQKAFGKAEPGAAAKLGLGLCSGAVASFSTNPVEVALVRMQADGRLPAAERRNYANVFSAFYRIGVEEGAATYMSGVVPNVVRACVVNMLQIGGYDIAKSNIKATTGIDGVPLHLSSSLASGFVYSVGTLPLDTAKTRMQSQKPLADGTMRYQGMVGTIAGIARTEGLASLWRGFGAYFFRCGGHTITMFMFFEQFKKLADARYEKA